MQYIFQVFFTVADPAIRVRPNMSTGNHILMLQMPCHVSISASIFRPYHNVGRRTLSLMHCINWPIDGGSLEGGARERHAMFITSHCDVPSRRIMGPERVDHQSKLSVKSYLAQFGSKVYVIFRLRSEKPLNWRSPKPYSTYSGLSFWHRRTKRSSRSSWKIDTFIYGSKASS